MGKIGGYSFRYFKKDKNFTKSHIIQELSNFPDSKQYIPDDINPLYLSREYLFTVSVKLFMIMSYVLETVSPHKYVELYHKYKEKISNKKTK